MNKKAFEAPTLNVIRFAARDVLTASPNWDLPIVAEETTKPSGWETPIYP